MKNRNTTSLVVGCVVALLAPLLYVGGYYCMLADDPYSYDPKTGDTPPVYRFNKTAIHLVFKPAHELDRWIRPRFWEAPP